MALELTPEEKQMTELVRQRMKDSMASNFFGFEVESAQKGRVVFVLDVDAEHKQHQGVVHGGILAAMVDTTAAIACYTVIAPGTEIATLELNINYLEPVPGGKIKADAKVLRTGRNFLVAECEILNENGTLAAKALLTFSAAAGHTLQK
jgi:uncharacterized protein (TIGR00369 family)